MSGEIASGKTAVASELSAQYGYQRVRSGNYLAEIAKTRGLPTDRHGLQEIGDLLDEETRGSWIAELAQKQISETRRENHWVLDSVRRDFQVYRFRDQLCAEVIHVHLTVPANVLNARFDARAKDDDRDSGTDYSRVKASKTEQHAKGLGNIADISANSGTFTPSQIARLIDMTVRLRSEEATA